MAALTLYTNLFADNETAKDLRKRGKAVRFHPDPEASRADARDADLIVVLELRVPDDAAFLIYRETARGTAVLAQGADFGAAYREASALPADNEAPITAILEGRPGAERRVVPLADYITGMAFHIEAPDEARLQ